MPFLLARLKDGKWQKTNVPSPAGPTEAGESVSACIVADMDNDGLWDILQPRAEYGLLWKGTMQGLAVPTRVPISDPNGKSAFALGDFDQDGFLDVFACAPERTELWENDGKGGFRPVSRWAGSLSPKTPAGASIARAVDLNHDGRQDIALIYPDGSFMYHFNRGFRCFADEGEPKLPGTPEPQPVRACTVADLNGDGAEDLAIALGTGEVFCCLNECFVKAGLRVSLKPGTPGPVTLSVWPGGTRFPCLGAWPFGGSCPTVFLGFPRPGRYALNWDQPGKPKIGKEVDLTQESAGSIREIILGE
jgi:hypothetical protein